MTTLSIAITGKTTTAQQEGEIIKERLYVEPDIAVVLPTDDFIILEEDKEYANIVQDEDSPEVDFYFAAKGYILDIDTVEAAWEAR